MISIKNVSKSYDKKNRIINNLNLEINDGEIFGFLGPNGAGKSTTIKMITVILSINVIQDCCLTKANGIMLIIMTVNINVS